MAALPNYVLCERTQEHDQITLARIYRLAYDVLQHTKYKLLYTPLQHVQHTIDHTYAVCPGTDDDDINVNTRYDHPGLCHELTEFWVDMWSQHGIVSWNFHLFRQQDGRIAIVHLDNFGFHNWTTDRHWITMPCNVSVNHFFADSVFPNDFYERIRDVDGVSPVFHGIIHQQSFV
jgi:hypothetical protein